MNIDFVVNMIMDDIMDGTVVVPLFMSVIVGCDKIDFVDLNRKIVLAGIEVVDIEEVVDIAD